MAKKEKFTYIKSVLAIQDSDTAIKYEVKAFELGFYINILHLKKGKWELHNVTTRNNPKKSDRYLLKLLAQHKDDGYIIRDQEEGTVYKNNRGFYEN